MSRSAICTYNLIGTRRNCYQLPRHLSCYSQTSENRYSNKRRLHVNFYGVKTGIKVEYNTVRYELLLKTRNCGLYIPVLQRIRTFHSVMRQSQEMSNNV